MGVGIHMREGREILGLPQREVAEALEVATPMISYYEREETPITTRRAELAANLLCLTLDEIYHGVPPARELKRRYYTRLLARLNEEAEAEARVAHSGRDNSHRVSPNQAQKTLAPLLRAASPAMSRVLPALAGS